MDNFVLEMEAIGKRIAEIRKESKLTQEQIAQKTGYSRNTIVNIENGKISESYGFLYEFKRVTGASLDYLFTGKESITESSPFLELLSLFKRLSPKKQEVILSLLKEFTQ